MQKYDQNRDRILTGDIILFRNSTKMMWLSKSIQHFDKAYYNHIGLVFAFGTGVNKRLFILDSNAPGVQPDFLSDRMDMYEDFCVLRPRPQWRDIGLLESAVSRTIQRAQTHIKYDFMLILEVATERSLGRNVMNIGQGNRDICSEFIYRYVKELYTIAYDYTKNTWGWISPQDFLRFRDQKEFDLLLDTNPGIEKDYQTINQP